MNLEEYEKLQPTATISRNGKILKFNCPNSFTLWRAKTLFQKEISTINWLDSLDPSGALLDVGANVGGYTIYAAVVRGLHVDAIEPEAQNFSLLCRNVLLNNVAHQVSCWPIGVSDEIGLQKLFISDLRIGGSNHSLKMQVDFKLQEKKFLFAQGCYSTTIDELVSQQTIRFPNFIKIDVDGLEHKVILGARNTLENAKCCSLSIELHTKLKEHISVISFLKQEGFSFEEGQVEAALRREGTFKDVAEFVFRRG